MLKELLLRKANENDIKDLQSIFFETIYIINSKHYTKQQILVWASAANEQEKWNEIIKTQLVLIAEINQTTVGFITLTKESCVDLLYVHKDYQRRGIAKAIYREIEKECIRQSHKIIKANVSITARPFFENMGFEMIAEQTVIRKGVALINYKMEKELPVK